MSDRWLPAVVAFSFTTGRARRAQLQRRVLAAVSLALLSMGALVALQVWNLRLTSVDLATQQKATQAAQAEVDSYAPALVLQASYESKATVGRDVLATDVAWGQLLDNLGRAIPDRVWLQSLGLTMEGPAATDSQDTASLGRVEVAGTAFDYPDVSSWLRTINSSLWPQASAGWASTMQQSTIGEIPVVTFSSTADLTPAALSTRADERIPVVAP